MPVTIARPMILPTTRRRTRWAVCLALAGLVASPAGAGAICQATSGERLTPVIELYTSEGCSSCPPADQWLSTLKGQPVVAQAFHVAYWDSLGWKDRFASAAFTARQREIAQANRLGNIYTPQLVRNGRDWRPGRLPATTAVAGDSIPRAAIHLQRLTEPDSFEARVAPTDAAGRWTAYWTVTEHGHQSRVTAGENAGESLKHDFVVRQYVPVGQYSGAQVLKFRAIAPLDGHARQINLVVSDVRTGEPLQAVSLGCS